MSGGKIGVYLCDCAGEIDKTVDFDALAAEASGLADVAVARKHASLCSQQGTAAIREDVAKLGLDRVVIAACSPFLKAKEFAGLVADECLIERLNLREQCSRVHADNPGDATKKAKVLLQLSLARLREAKPRQKAAIAAVKAAMVVGGGVAGINAALDLANAGVDVFLVEKQRRLGGNVSALHRYFPRMCPPSCGLDLMVAALEANPRIQIFTSCEVAGMSGSPGNYSVTLRTASPAESAAELKTVAVGAIIVATGWQPFDPSPLTEYGYGKLEHVVTNLDFEKLARKDKAFLGQAEKTAFIQCVGSRDERHLPYCSDVCCTVSIKQALALKQANPRNEVFIFHNDIRTPGEYEDLYRQARLAGVVFIKGTPAELAGDTPGKINFSVFDTVAGERLDMAVDRVVLAVGMAPAGNEPLKETLGLRLNANGFVESHLQCHPQDTRQNGVFAAGCSRAPMDVGRSIDSAGAAAVKALGLLEHEKPVAAGVPEVNVLKCDGCKRCVQECPFDAYAFDANGLPCVDPAKCRQCGICMGGCPLGAISSGELAIEQLSAMLDALDASYLGEDEPVVLAFLCKNDAYRAADDAALAGLSYPANVISVMVPCSGAVNGAIVAEAISKGVDGILVAGCPDNQCHYIEGSALARARLTDVANKLKDMYLEPERVKFASVERDDPETLCRTLEEYVQELRAMGRNPLRVT